MKISNRLFENLHRERGGEFQWNANLKSVQSDAFDW